MSQSIHRSFTLIEMLIVIVIIGVLAIALIPRLQGFRKQTRVSAAVAEMRDFNNALLLARIGDLRTLIQITWRGCTNCVCRSLPSLQWLSVDDPCRLSRYNSLSKVSIAAGMWPNWLQDLDLDPRWAPYQLDENEWEIGNFDCRVNSFYSAGPDWLIRTSDDINMNIAPVYCSWSY